MQDILYLVRCVLNNQMPNINQLREPEREKILKLARAHSLIAMIVTALEQAGEKPGQMWLREREKAVRKSILFDAEYQRIADYMEQQGIWHMPLKGRILQNLYRQKGMRQMADVDLLFDEKYREQMQQFMLQSGYTVKCFEQGNHDVYVKPPVYNFEFHVSLYGDVHEESFKEYYKNIHHRLHHVEGKMQELCFRPEDFYIYFVSHMYKHYMGSGTGIRSLADCYLLLIKEKDTLDWHYIKEECQKLNMEEFEFKIPVDELDISNMSETSKVYVSIDALPKTIDEPIEGRIEKLPLEGVTVGGVTDYYVTIAIPYVEGLRIGMNASADVVVSESVGTLRVPVECVSKENGKYYVEVVNGENIEKREVEIGIQNTSYYEIVSGLTKEEEVVVPQQSIFGIF